ncbi:UDP-4-amino-4,6-dideoxy-N-acetyl-beta-L-altrosamine transaminase [Psychrobacter sp. DAB_AL32B]|uniref:UDP-4-amino-4, 6-dideoxy-N-acetyl-beta-L-altrosamine transaminase n=1 Tax=Psychrobacter sp. DAB_AL32B TaxID=1028414 RepID=UPI000B7F2468|nr:UDP-4-amino-4,6-dideoxy-N-acetyl-beta-L-altrosamine transaminase [Psychrobacter sp. DAB_AL32B]OXL20541.1 UDP-4-amino-4,6-dideoxy-N-acetyl-beta-L-altrosamine transaminase [Psychrobacter sp. DAB_AL32B]
MIPYSRQDINQQDINAVVEVLKSDFLTQGPQVPAFEQAIIDACDAKYAVAVNSATSALHIACLALGLGNDDWLWTTPNTFVASANCALYCGAKVDFVDIDPRTYNLCAKQLEKKLIAAEKVGKLPKIVIPVHFSGQPCDMQAIHELAKKYGFKIIEDASHAIGGKYQDVPIGNSRYSDITIFSFHPVKIVTSAEGGAAVTNRADLAEKMLLLRSHGITRDDGLMTQIMDGPWYYQQIALGFNYRMTELQAALGLSQMQRLEEFVIKRHELASRYDGLLQNLPITLPWQHPDSYSARHLYVIRLQLEQINTTHLDVFNALRAAGILVNLHYIPVHMQPYYQKQGFESGQFPEAEKYYKEAISIPMFPAMTDEQQNTVCATLQTLLCIRS